jgi:hypothetical protein
VITKTLEQRPTDATHWSTRSMAKATGMSQTAISRIWRAFGLQPHGEETFKLSTDPQFIETRRRGTVEHADEPALNVGRATADDPPGLPSRAKLRRGLRRDDVEMPVEVGDPWSHSDAAANDAGLLEATALRKLDQLGREANVGYHAASGLI